MQTLIQTTKDGREVHVPLRFGAQEAAGDPTSQMFDQRFDAEGEEGDPPSQIRKLNMALDDVSAALQRGPRERATDQGVGAISDADLLSILLGTGLTGCPVTQLSYALIARFGGLEGLARLSPRAIAAHPGVGMAKALRVAAGLEAGRRSVVSALKPRPEILTSVGVAEWFTSRLGWRDQEELWSLSLDGRNGLRSARRIAQGGLHGVHLTVRDILTAGLQDAAAAIILVHNHPSGDPMPSHEDLEMTQRVALAGQSIGMPLVDHVIVSSTGRYSSMLDLGLLPSN